MNPMHHRKRGFQKGLAMHVVLKANVHAFWGKPARDTIDKVLKYFGKHFEVKIYHRATVGTHLHLILLPKSQNQLSGFLRVIAGQISMKLWKAKGEFWQCRPWSRLVQWGKRDYGTAIKYVALNYLEGVKKIIRNKDHKSELKIYADLIQAVLDQRLTSLGTL